MLAITITHYFYVPGSLCALDAVHPFTQRGCYGGQTKDELIAKHGTIEVLTERELQERIKTAALTSPEEITHRPKKALGGLTPAAYARQLAAKAIPSTQGL